MIKRVTIIYILGVFLAGIIICICAFGPVAGEEVPLPQGSQLQHSQIKPVGGVDYGFDFYAVDAYASSSSIADFYQRKLTALGWQEFSLRTELPKVPGYSLNSDIAKAQAIANDNNNLIFTKAGMMLTVTILPADRFADHKMRFMLGQSKAIIEPQVKPPAEVQEALGKQTSVSDKYSIPIYPGATVLYSKEDKEKKSLVEALTSKNSVAEVAEFYKQAMQKAGWSIEKEQPVHLTTEQEFRKAFENFGSSCSACVQKAQAIIKDMKYPQGYLADFVFSKGNSYCVVGIFAHEAEKDEPSLKLTHITVAYAENQKQ